MVSIEPKIVDDSVEGGEGIPSPMLAVTGLSVKELAPHIKKTNSFLPENSKLFVSLNNGPRALVITGPARALYGLVTNLRKVRAASGADQSKLPFSKRKPAFNVRFLAVGVPYHSDYLKGATDKVLSDLGSDELWSPADLKVPVFNTEDGASISFFVRVRITDISDYRFRPSLPDLFGHAFALRPNLHCAHPLDQGH